MAKSNLRTTTINMGSFKVNNTDEKTRGISKGNTYQKIGNISLTKGNTDPKIGNTTETIGNTNPTLQPPEHQY